MTAATLLWLSLCKCRDISGLAQFKHSFACDDICVADAYPTVRHTGSLKYAVVPRLTPHALCILAMQVALRWSGDANIAIAIELPAGGEATRMVPKVSELHINAIGRVLLAPLVGEIPGFGAAVISLR